MKGRWEKRLKEKKVEKKKEIGKKKKKRKTTFSWLVFFFFFSLLPLSNLDAFNSVVNNPIEVTTNLTIT